MTLLAENFVPVFDPEGIDILNEVDLRRELKERIGRNVRRLRKQKKLSIEQLGFEVNISARELGKVERAQSLTNVVNLVKLASVLEVEVCDLLLDK